MRVALFDGPDALATIDMPVAAAADPKPWEVRVAISNLIADPASPEAKYLALHFHGCRISVLTTDKSVGRTWIAACANPETAKVLRAALAGAAEIPGVLPQHVPKFIETLRGLLKAKG